MLGGTFAPAFLERRFGQSSGSDCLCNAAQMERVLRREIARADRGGRGFSLVLFRVKPGQPDYNGTRQLVHVLLKRARLTDEVGWFSDNYLCAVLTGTPERGARVFAEGVIEVVARHAPRPVAVVYTYPSADVSLPGAIGAEAPSVDADGEARAEPDHYVHNHKTHNGNGNNGHGNNGHGHGPNGHHNGHKRGNGHANGFKHLNGEGASSDPSPSTDVIEIPAAAQVNNARDLLKFVQEDADAEKPGLPAGSVEDLLAAPLPWWKRVIDIAGALFGIAVFSPLMIGAALAIKLSSPGPVIFRQKRSGLGGRPFTIYKFRTMVDGAEARRKELAALSEQDGPAFKLANDPRLTALGKFLRKTSIDEMPQLFNVLKGDMSLVGPRPLPCAESEGCMQWQRHRMNITPGLTCIWQVKGRSRVGFDDWIRMDMAYMRRRTFWKDIQIIFATIPAVLLRRGAK
jgi:lipopolysaccharide/colanic/teichoic acid biosynthesis glycosyltransferase